jgi:hypothetical protein
MALTTAAAKGEWPVSLWEVAFLVVDLGATFLVVVVFLVAAFLGVAFFAGVAFLVAAFLGAAFFAGAAFLAGVAFLVVAARLGAARV